MSSISNNKNTADAVIVTLSQVREQLAKVSPDAFWSNSLEQSLANYNPFSGCKTKYPMEINRLQRLHDVCLATTDEVLPWDATRIEQGLLAHAVLAFPQDWRFASIVPREWEFAKDLPRDDEVQVFAWALSNGVPCLRSSNRHESLCDAQQYFNVNVRSGFFSAKGGYFATTQLVNPTGGYITRPITRIEACDQLQRLIAYAEGVTA